MQHVEHSSSVRAACDIQVGERQGPGRPKITCKQLMENNCREWNDSQPPRKEHLEHMPIQILMVIFAGGLMMAGYSGIWILSPSLTKTKIHSPPPPLLKFGPPLTKTLDPHMWRPGVRSAMRAAPHLPGRGPTDLDDTPAR